MSLARTVRAVLWSFVGIRRRSGLEDDMQRLNPLHVVAVRLVAVALFVGGLVALVHWIT